MHYRMSNDHKACLAASGMFITFLITWGLAMIGSVFLLELVHMRTGTRLVSKRTMDYRFPVLVVTPSSDGGCASDIVCYRGELEYYLKEHPKYSFLVPAGKIDEVNRQLAKQSDDRRGGRQTVKILWQRKDKQYIRVNGDLGEELVARTGWYVADSRSMTPRQELIFRGRLCAFEAMPVGTFLNLVGWAIGASIYGRRKARRARANG